MLRQVGLTQGCIKHAVSGWGRLVPIFRDKTKRDELSLVLSIQIASGFELDATLAPIQRAGFLVATQGARHNDRAMRIAKSVSGMQRLARHWQRAGVRIGFVPTMGYLHAGHLSLVRRARRAVGDRGKVVLSIYVNPTQFGPSEDFSRYPRDLGRDLRLCREAGVDVVFTPGEDSMYPGKARGNYSTYVVEERLSQSMEGRSRPTHFRGVTTIVAKLFNVVLPNVAVFGAKDWQQAAVIRRMAADLNFPVRIIVAPTLRERDGLAMSSRNKYLEGDLRRQALVLSRAIKHVARRVAKARRGLPAGELQGEVAAMIRREPQARLDYVEFFEPDTLAPLRQVGRGAHLAMAVFVGPTRLIDNARL